jgi:hypothetical protein
VTHCLPERLHPLSRIFLDYYLDVARCIVRVVAGQ